jgi:plastocyanin domain-containing protein
MVRMLTVAMCLGAAAAFACDDCLEDEVPAPRVQAPVQSLELELTDSGFAPRELKVKAGVPLRLKVTLKSDKACAGAGFLVRGHTVAIPLPVRQAVEVELTLEKKGRVAVSCGKATGALLVD